jgi:hypothetical protein
LAATPSPFGFFPISDYPRGHKKGRHPRREGRREGEPRAAQGTRDRNRPLARAGGATRRFDGGGVKTTATIELSGPVRCLIVYSGVPRAPTAQNDEKFGTRPTAFKLLRPG